MPGRTFVAPFQYAGHSIKVTKGAVLFKLRQCIFYRDPAPDIKLRTPKCIVDFNVANLYSAKDGYSFPPSIYALTRILMQRNAL